MPPLGLQLQKTAVKAITAFTPKDTIIEVIVYPDISADVNIAWIVSVELRLPCGSILDCEVPLPHKPFYNMLEIAQHIGKAVADYVKRFQTDRMV